MTQPTTPRLTPVCRRLWMAGVGMLLFLCVLIAASCLAGPGRSLLGGTHGSDLIPSYMAGSFVREGQSDKLMDLAQAVRFQANLRQANGLEQNGRTGPWLNPPWFAALFVPLSTLSFPAAQQVWLAFNLLLLAASIVLLCRMIMRPTNALTPQGGWRLWGLVPLLLVTSMPFIQALASQQNTFLSLFLLTLTVWLWRKANALRAGLVAGLLLFKPQLAAVVAVVLCCSLGRRAILGLAITAIALVVSTSYSMPGALTDYLHKLPAMLPWLQNGRPYAWERQVTFQGFWRLLLQGRVTGPASPTVQVLWAACALAVGAMLLPAIRCAVMTSSQSNDQTHAPTSRDRLIAATIAVMPLLTPYFMDYDLMLLAVPAVLFAAERARADVPPDRASRALVIGWAVLFPWLFINAEFGATTRVSLTVPLLALIAGLHACRAARRVPAGPRFEAIRLAAARARRGPLFVPNISAVHAPQARPLFGKETPIVR